MSVTCSVGLLVEGGEEEGAEAGVEVGEAEEGAVAARAEDDAWPCRVA